PPGTDVKINGTSLGSDPLGNRPRKIDFEGPSDAVPCNILEIGSDQQAMVSGSPWVHWCEPPGRFPFRNGHPSPDVVVRRPFDRDQSIQERPIQWFAEAEDEWLLRLRAR